MFTEQEAMLGSARECCEAILRRYGREQDDATVLIAEFLP
jgi:hypothetical protein